VKDAVERSPSPLNRVLNDIDDLIDWSRCLSLGMGNEMQVNTGVLVPACLCMLALACEQEDDPVPAPPGCEIGFVHDSELSESLLDEFSDGCVPESCGAERWGTIVTDGSTVFVDVDAGSGGDGTEARPFGSIQDGLEAAGNQGIVVAVAAGTYFENIELGAAHDGVHLAGRCPELVVVDAGEGVSNPSGILANAGSSPTTEWTVSDVTVKGATYAGVLLTGGELTLQGSTISDHGIAGVLAAGFGSSVTLSNTTIRDTNQTGELAFGAGIQIEGGAHLDARNCMVERSTWVGIIILNESTSLLRDVDVRDTRPDWTGNFGYGISVENQSTMDAEDCTVEGSTKVGVSINDLGTHATLSRVEVRDTYPTHFGKGGYGVSVFEGATLVAHDCLLEDNTGTGLMAHGDDTEVWLTDVEIKRTARDSYHSVASGVISQEQAVTIADRLLVEQTSGPGLLVGTEGYLSCSDCDIRDSAFAGVVVWGSAYFYATDSWVINSVADANEWGGVGIYAFGSTGSNTVDIDNLLIEGHPLSALWFDGHGSNSITNSTLTGGGGSVVTYPNGETVLVHGDAVVATNDVQEWNGAIGLLLQDNVIQDAVRSGVILDGSSAVLSGNTFSGNAIDIIWQRCAGIEEPDGIGSVTDVDFCPAYNHPVAPLEFNLYLKDAIPL
jgi:Right handed beta helix region